MHPTSRPITHRFLTIVVAAAVLGGVLVTAASPGTAATRRAGSTTLRSLATLDSRLADDYAVTGTAEAYSSPVIGDITGDGQADIVSATLDGTVTAYSTNGYGVLWRRVLGHFAIHASPVIADLSGTGRPDVIIGAMNGTVYWLDGRTGQTIRTFSELPPLYCPAGVDCRPHGFFATPVVADINGDGHPDLVAASWDHSVYAWEANGHLLFRSFLYDTLWSSPVVADVFGNGKKEIILGGDIYAGNPVNKPAGGLLWMLSSKGVLEQGYPLAFPGQTIWSSPAVVDLDGNGQLDAVMGTGTNDPFGDGPQERLMYAVNLRTGRELPGWPVQLDGRAPQGPAVGDLLGDGHLEVAVGSEGGYVYVYKANGQRMWRACAATSGTCGPNLVSHGSAVIADVDGDGRQEVVAAMDKTLFVFDGATGAVKGSFPLSSTTYPPPSIPTIGSVGGNTVIAEQSVFQPTPHSSGITTGDVSRVTVVTTDAPFCKADWPQFKRNAQRTALLPVGGDPWRPFGCIGPFVAQQYTDFLGRPSDAGGVNFWTTRIDLEGWTGPRVIQSFMDSPEFGRVRAPLVRVYEGLTGRPPKDVAVFTSQAQRLSSGTTLATIAQELATSATTVDGSGLGVSGKSNATFVTDAYRFTFGRTPSAAEQSAGLAALSAGTSRGAWLAGLVGSPAAVKRLVPEVYVTMSYLGMLARVPDASGYAFWVTHVRKGSSIQGLIGGFQRSTEYRSRVLQ